LRAEYGVESGSFVWFQESLGCLPADARCTRLLLKVFGGEQQPDLGSVNDLRSCPREVRSTFAAFTRSLAGDGFDFLRERFEAGEVDGPILVTVDSRRVVGAIGPMQVMLDSLAARRLLPQYLGVLPECRGRGHGRNLWRAAMHWGLVHNAAYQLLQTEVDGPSDRLYLSEGLCTMGFVCAVSI
jgi:GNAT superfamily N-acetyltransferase